MRKYVIGLVIGFGLSFAFGANAEIKSLLNSVVQGTFPVMVDGKRLDSDALVVEGSTYLPVRSFGEAIGYKVGFDADLGVNLTKIETVEKKQKEVTGKVPTPVDNTAPVRPKTLDNIEYLLESRTDRLKRFEADLKQLKNEPEGKKEEIKLYENGIEELKAEIAELEREKAELLK